MYGNRNRVYLCLAFIGVVSFYLSVLVNFGLTVFFVWIYEEFHDRCDWRPPVWLLVQGVTSTFACIIGILDRCYGIKKRYCPCFRSLTCGSFRRFRSVFYTIMLLFSLGWLITGSAWMFGMVDRASCASLPFDTAFWYIVVVWCLSGLGLLGLVFYICLLLVGASVMNR